MNRILPVLALLAAAALLALLFFGSEPEAGPVAPAPPPVRPAQGPPRPEPPPPRAPSPSREDAPPGAGAAGAAAPGASGPAGSGAGAEVTGPARPSLAEPAEREPRDVPFPVRAHVPVELAGELEGASVTAALFPKTGDGKAAPTGIPVENGRVLIPDVGSGDYVLEIAAEKAGRVVRERREVTIGEGPVEIDPVRILPDAGIRARVVDAAGRPIPQATVVVVREDEKPEEARRLTPGADGYVLYGDLEPSSYHRVVVLGIPEALEKTVRTPETRGQATEVELRAADSLVVCRVVLRLPESAPEGAIAVREGPLRPKLRPGERELIGTLMPGEYPIRASVAGSPAVYRGRLFVPATGPFEGTVDLVPE